MAEKRLDHVIGNVLDAARPPCGRVVLVTIQPLTDGGWVDIQEDITERRRSEQKLNWLARHDPLTEIANRADFREALERAFRDSRPAGKLWHGIAPSCGMQKLSRIWVVLCPERAGFVERRRRSG